MKLIINEAIATATPYMIRNDGNCFECGAVHPYISIHSVISESVSAAIRQLLVDHFSDLRWFYDNTSHESLKKFIRDFLQILSYNKFFMLTSSNINEIKEVFGDIDYKNDNMKTTNKTDFINLFKVINDECNQEFLRVRVSDKIFGGTDYSIYFRVSSAHFNWFPIIWQFVYDNKSQIDNVTIVRDAEMIGGIETFYKCKNNVFDHIPTKEFLTLDGNPIIEKSEDEGLNIILKCLNEGRSMLYTFGKRHPAHLHRYFNFFSEDYTLRNFVAKRGNGYVEYDFDSGRLKTELNENKTETR